MVTKVKQSGIADLAVGQAQLASDSVTAGKIVDGAVGAPEIEAGAVGTIEIADGAVTADKLAATLDLSGKTMTLPAANTPALTKYFEATQVAIVSAALITWAHALTVAPKLILPEIVCITGELGWVAGDRMVISCGAGSDSAANRGMAVYYDTTNVYVRLGSAASPIVINHKTSGATAAITNANWRLIVRAWA
jgi:hypothetical protein